MKIEVISNLKNTEGRKISIEGTYDEYNLSEMRKQVGQLVGRFLRKKLEGHLLIHEIKNGVRTCIATVSINFPDYKE